MAAVKLITSKKKERVMENETSGLIIFDLDNTLVDKNAVFEKAQEKMIEIIKGKKGTKDDMKILRDMDSILIKKNGSHIYPFEILALSLWLYYHKNMDVEASVQQSLDIFQGHCRQTEDIGKAHHLTEKATRVFNNILENTPAPLFEGVKEVLQVLRERGYTLALVSEGTESLQKKTLEAHKLEHYFDDVVLCTRKDKECFLRIKKRWGRTSDGKELKVIVVGDGIERDIEPGNEIGAITIWKPGNFNPGTPSPGLKQPHYSIKDIKSLPRILH